MFDIGGGELVVIGIVALVAIGPKELPAVLRTVGRYMGKIKRMSAEFQGQFQEALREAEFADLKKHADEITSSVSEFSNIDPLADVQKDVEKSFEEAALPESAFDLGASATAFHWLEQRSALAKVAALLKPGGWWAMWWNVFGDPERADPFHEATSELLRADLPPGERHDWRPNFALDREARLASLDADGLFEGADCRMTRWTLTLDPAGVRALYASFSHIGQLGESERRRILDRLAEIAEKEFGGRVERNMVTALYAARRRADHWASGQPVSSNTSSSRASQASSLASA